jgi:hypothetical protein
LNYEKNKKTKRKREKYLAGAEKKKKRIERVEKCEIVRVINKNIIILFIFLRVNKIFFESFSIYHVSNISSLFYSFSLPTN